MSHKTLFLVDDEPAIPAIIARTLRRVPELAGLVIKTFPNPQDALEEIGLAGMPDVVLTDDLMPLMTGREFATELRARGFTGKVLMLSGTATDEVLALGVDQRFEKPFEAAILRKVLTDLLAPPALAADQPPAADQASA